MKQTVYIDVLMAVNLFVTYFLLLSVRSFLHIPVGRGRLFLGALVGAAGSFLIFLPPLSPWLSFAAKLVLSFAISAAAFAPVGKKLFIKSVLSFYLCSFAFAGFMVAVWMIAAPQGLLVRNSVVYFSVSPLLLLVFTVAAYLVLYVIHSFTGQKEPKSRFCKVIISQKSQTICLSGKIDTGSTLAEPFSHKPVLVVQKESVKNILSADFEKTSVRMVPFQSISGKGVLPAFLPEKLQIELNGKRSDITGCYIAVCSQKLGQGQFSALIPPAALEISQDCLKQ